MRVALAAALLMAAPAAFAQAPRNGDEYNGKNHQPTKAQVVGKERAAGVAPSPARAGADNRSVEQLDRQLLGSERANPPKPVKPLIPPAGR